MSEPMKMRATLKGDQAEIRVLMSHPMETGLRKDAGGAWIPLHFIQSFTVKHNGRTVIEAQLSQAVSRNPVFAFRLNGARQGDKIEIGWLDNGGESRRDETLIA